MYKEHPGAIPPWVPTDMQTKIDLTELSVTDPAILNERELLSAELEANVAVYPAHSKGRPHGLCSVYRAAKLSEVQIQRLQLSEQKYACVVFVAYHKPLQRHNELNIQ